MSEGVVTPQSTNTTCIFLYHAPHAPTTPRPTTPFPTVILPDAVTCRDMPVTVELTGTHTRGMTVCDLREFVMAPDEPRAPSGVSVSVEVDAGRMKEVFRKAVLLSEAHAGDVGLK